LSSRGEEWHASTLARDHEVFRLHFERHHPPLVRYLTAQTGDPFLAEDIAQDAFLAAYQHLEDLEDGRPFALGSSASPRTASAATGGVAPSSASSRSR
jgi:hypothetical protein